MENNRRGMTWSVVFLCAVSACKTSDGPEPDGGQAGDNGGSLGGAPSSAGATATSAGSGTAGAAGQSGQTDLPESGRGGSGGDGASASGGESVATTNCAASPKPKSGGAVGTVVGTQPNALVLLPTSGVAASIVVKEGVHQLFLRLTDYANACDYFSVGLGKQSADEAEILLDTGTEALAIGTYHTLRNTGAPGKTATISWAPGSRCMGDLFAFLPNGTIEVTALDGQHVALNIDLQGSPLAFTGRLDAPLCSGPQKCGCAP